MKYKLLSILLLATAALFGGCVKDEIEEIREPEQPGQSGESHFQIAVNSFTVGTRSDARASVPSENPEPESEDEKRIKNFWLFQFDAAGKQLKAPAYYELTDAAPTLDDLTKSAYTELVRNTPMTLYVVTNVGSSTWASGDGFNTLEGVKMQKLPAPMPIQAGVDEVLIPMSGQVDNITVTDNTFVMVPVKRMYAKLKIQASFEVSDMLLYDANITGIPWYCKVSPLDNGLDANGEPAAVPFPDKTMMISRAFKSIEAVTDESGEKWLVLYIPENLRGEVEGADKKASLNIPDNTLTISIRAKYNGMDYYFKVYPGENVTNNFNIRRNCVYRVTVDVNSTEDQHNPSSNCFIVEPGDKLIFEPYNRVEKGGGYKIEDYLTPDDEAKRIEKVEIVWQTFNCIGDNTNGDLVYLGPETNPKKSRKIIVMTKEEGNALIAARNVDDEIVWSWHIWVTPNKPDNLANAVVYTTYRWDKDGIYNKEPRVPGYGIMPCNIGALAFRSEDDMPYDNRWSYYYVVPHYSIPARTIFPESQIRTFGMLYQWGRKDPFPPMIYSTGVEDGNGSLGYTNDYTETHYANDNTAVVNKTSSLYLDDNMLESYLFHSEKGGKSVAYSIQHPTIYITSNSNGNNDWCSPSDDRLWGASESSTVEYTIPDSGGEAHLRNNYGTKSIFDPCPKGWRVPPGDLWLGFTLTGLNPTNYEAEVNYCEKESGKRPGMSMYVRSWRGEGEPTVYFPLQGTRIDNGVCKNTGLCGNYHNATCDDGGRVNLLHLHRNMAIVSKNNTSLMLFKLFEYKTAAYYAKSTAGPIRCVRDSK